jgi:hypothetical protein
MTTFIRTLESIDKRTTLSSAIQDFRQGNTSENIYQVDAEVFRVLPSRTFAYWISEGVKNAFATLPRFDSVGYRAQVGGSTKDDFRFLRLWWETPIKKHNRWFPFAKGGAFSPFYADVYLAVNWEDDAKELEAAILRKYPYLGDTANWVLHRESSYFHPGITWPRRTKSRFAPRVLPSNCVFSEKGPSAFFENDSATELFCLLAILSTQAFRRFIEVQLSAADARAGGAANSYEIGIIRSTPIPDLPDDTKKVLSALAQDAWRTKRQCDLFNEASHAFLLPRSLLARIFGFDEEVNVRKLAKIEKELDSLVAAAYCLSPDEAADRAVISSAIQANATDSESDDDEDDENSSGSESDHQGLLSWCVGVVAGHFDWRLATGERAAPPEPGPFEPLPAKSAGMLPDGMHSFHSHAGILVEDQGHPHDLPRLIEEVLARVDAPVPLDVRRWLQRDFFAFHLQRYSKSRRKAPIYWPLSTTSGSYTLWVYHPSLTSQTLYTAINDLVEPKLKQVGADVTSLRNKGSARTREDEQQFEALQTFELELIELRDTLLKLAPTYKPNHDDGVQINASPLWPLFRHKPWQRVLKDTWAKLEKGDYDWAHLAMNYWPERVREKCKTDKSLAIAHGLEHLYVEPEAQPKKTRGRKKAGGDE